MANGQDSDLEPLLTNQQNQLGLIFSDSDSIDGKALAILGANIAIIIFVNQTAPHLELWKGLAVYGPFGLSLLLDVVSIWPRKYRGPGASPGKFQQYLNMRRNELLLQLLSDTQAAITHNSRLNRQRLKACLLSIALTGLGFLLLLAIL